MNTTLTPSSPQRQPAGFGAPSRPGPGGRGASGVPIFQRHTRNIDVAINLV